jgi:hypothetical protein
LSASRDFTKCPAGARRTYDPLLLTVLSIGLFAAALTGCHASGGVDTNSQSSLNQLH